MEPGQAFSRLEALQARERESERGKNVAMGGLILEIHKR